MDDYLVKIKQAAIPIIEKYNLIFYDMEETDEYGMNTIRILVDSKESLSVDIDDIEHITKELLDIVNDDIPDEYFLEVSSLGIERVLKTEDEIQKALGEYVYIETNNVIEKINDVSIYGYLNEVTDNNYIVEANIKGRKKEFEIKKDDCKLIRLAVKF